MTKSRINESNVVSYLLLSSLFVGAYTLAPLLATKIAQIGPLTLPAGDFIYALTFICTDTANEVFGKRHAKNIVKCGLIALVAAFIFTKIAVMLPGAVFWEGEAAYNQFFSMGYRMFVATLLAYVVSQFADIYVFSWIREKTGDRHLWLRNNVSTYIARLLDIVVFVLVAFYGVYGFEEMLKIISSGYAAGIIVSILSTPFVYASVYVLKKIHPELR